MSAVSSINDRYAAIRRANGGAVPAQGEYRNTSSLASPSPWLLELLNGGNSAAGPAVTDDTALTLAAVYACNRVLATAIASLPVGLFKSENGTTYPADNRPEHSLVADEPSELYTSYTFRLTLQLHLGLRGNAFARIYRNNRGGVREMRILHPNHVRPFLYNGAVWYESTPLGFMGDTTEREILAAHEVLHLKNMSVDGIVGRSPIAVLRDTIGIGLSNRNFLADIHRNGGRVRGALTYPGYLSTEQTQSIREGFVEAVGAGRFPMLEGGVDFKSLSLTPADAEYISAHNLTALDICAVYGVPPHKIAILDRATFSNIEHQGIEYVQETLLPIVKNWEPELRRKLLPANIQASHHFRFNLEGRMRGDLKSRMAAYAAAIQHGWMNADEIRELESMNPLPGGQGKIYLTPLNMVPASHYVDMAEDGGQKQDDEDETGANQAQS